MGLGNISQYMSSGILTHCFRTGSWTKPPVLAVCLASGGLLTTMTGSLGGCEIPNASGYARQLLNPADANWAAITYVNGSGSTNNLAAVTFGPCTVAPWPSAVFMAITDSGVYGSGNLLWFGALQVPKTLGVGDSFTFSIANVVAYSD